MSELGTKPVEAPKEGSLEQAALAALRGETLVQGLNRRFNDLLFQRAPYESRWSLLAQYITPHLEKFLVRSQERPATRSKILDNTAGRARRTMRAGLQAGMASPGRPWFEMSDPDPAVSGNREVQAWLLEFRDTILRVFDKSNFYQSLGMMLGDEITYMTSPLMTFEDDEAVCRYQVFPVGSYVIGDDVAGNVNQFGREFLMPVDQAAENFPIELLSDSVKNSLKQGRFTDTMVVRHGIYPRAGRNPAAFGTDAFAWEEVYWEYAGATGRHTQESIQQSAASRPGKILLTSGYEEFPVAVARWERAHGDVWGTDGPANEALPDIKELMAQRRAYSNALAKIVNPPMNADASLDQTALSILSGAINYGGSTQGKGTYAPSHEIKLSLSDVQEGMRDLRNSINEAFMVNLFLLIVGDNRAEARTAEEIRERIQEKSDVLGPVLERHSDDVFDKVINRTAGIIIRRSQPFWATGEEGALIRPPPPELEGKNLGISYVSEIASALKLTRVAPIERQVNFVSALSQLDPSALDTLDIDETAKLHGEAVGAPPTMSRSEAGVAQLREDRAEQQAAAVRAEQAQQLAGAAKDLSDTNVASAGSALEAITRGIDDGR